MHTICTVGVNNRLIYIHAGENLESVSERERSHEFKRERDTTSQFHTSPSKTRKVVPNQNCEIILLFYNNLSYVLTFSREPYVIIISSVNNNSEI